MVIVAAWGASLPEHGQQPFQGEINCSKPKASDPKAAISPASWHCTIKSLDNPEAGGEPADKGQSVSKIYGAAVLSWFREWLHKLVSDPVSLFTLILGVYTVGLYRETAGLRAAADQQKADTAKSLSIAKDAADAAKLSADAAIGVELPRLELEGASLITTAEPFIASGLAHGAIMIRLKNYGRTPAHILETQVGFCANLNLPEAPEYKPSGTLMEQMGAVVIPGDIKTIDCSGRFTIDFDDAKAIAADEMDLWVYGFIGFRDFLGGRWQSKFCVRFVPFEGNPSFINPNLSPAYSGHQRYNPHPIVDR